jgi:hypothetical protein
MVILRVAMGQAWRKETAKEICSTIVFAKPALDWQCEQGQVVRTTIGNAEGPIFRPRTPADDHGTPVYGHTSTDGSV